MRAQRAGAVTLAAAALLAAGCHSSPDAVLVVVVTLTGSLPSVAALEVKLTGPAGSADNQYARGAKQTIIFPTTLTARVAAHAAGDITIDVQATDPDGNMVAEGRAGPFTLVPGARQTVYVRLDCADGACRVDGGSDGASAGPPDGGGGDAAQNCGNGRIDPGETCDTAIAAGAPGACPRTDCDDGLACTVDRRTGDACTTVCQHDQITSATAGDGCCPAGAQSGDDPDCSPTCGNGALEPGETCDTAIRAGRSGACPTAAECDDRDPCTRDLLVSAATCAAVCTHVPTVAQSGARPDGCCPAGAWHALDVDCPIACGNGIIEEGETCEIALPIAEGGCPRGCDDGDPCTIDFLEGTGCRATCAHTTITALISGDDCCPAGGNRSDDDDCPAACGNGALEPGESCDKMATGAAACPTNCPAAPSACVRRMRTGSAADCTTRCETAVVTACVPDGCCPTGCTAATDVDCSRTCGDGVVQTAAHETCDTAIATGAPGACPTTCSDGNACTQDLLLSAGTCHAACVFLPITAFKAGDGCCPPGGNFAVDPDCPPVCGNGVTETPSESCDFAATPGACPAACPSGGACALTRLAGAPATCNARCVTTAITACASADGCCPPGCTAANDSDCPALCGDGVVSPRETCDQGITAGQPGACAPTCDDGDACTLNLTSGTALGCSRVCTHVRVTACLSGDGCCPPGCAATGDRDCAGTCGDGRIGAGETCDPPASCPTTCPDDGDRCTRERLSGDAAHCSAACHHDPITACSGTTPDLCCPTGCTPGNDIDC